MTIILDFDYTLFDTARFKEALVETMTACGTTRERWFETYREVVGRRSDTYEYDPDLQIELLSSELTCSTSEVRSHLENIAASAGDYVYPGALDFLRHLRENGHRLVMLTLGNERWQELKLRHSGIASLMDEIVFESGDKAKVIRRLVSAADKAVVINDNAEEILRMRLIAPTAQYLLKRGPKGVPTNIDIPVCDSFAELERQLMAQDRHL